MSEEIGEIIDPRPDPASPEARDGRSGKFKKGNKGGPGGKGKHIRKAALYAKARKTAFTVRKVNLMLERARRAGMGVWDSESGEFRVQPNIEAQKLWLGYAIGKPTQQIDLKVEGQFSLDQRIAMALVAAGMKAPDFLQQISD